MYCESQFVIELLNEHFCVRVALRSREEKWNQGGFVNILLTAKNVLNPNNRSDFA